MCLTEKNNNYLSIPDSHKQLEEKSRLMLKSIFEFSESL